MSVLWPLRGRCRSVVRGAWCATACKSEVVSNTSLGNTISVLRIFSAGRISTSDDRQKKDRKYGVSMQVPLGRRAFVPDAPDAAQALEWRR